MHKYPLTTETCQTSYRAKWQHVQVSDVMNTHANTVYTRSKYQKGPRTWHILAWKSAQHRWYTGNLRLASGYTKCNICTHCARSIYPHLRCTQYVHIQIIPKQCTNTHVTHTLTDQIHRGYTDILAILSGVYTRVCGYTHECICRFRTCDILDTRVAFQGPDTHRVQV